MSSENFSFKKHNNGLRETPSVWKEVYEWIDVAVITVVCLLLVFTFIFRQVKIDGDSMNSTLIDGERVIISDLFYSPENSDIVVVSDEVVSDTPIIKRVIATEGQWINIFDGVVYVGESLETMTPLNEEYLNGKSTDSVIYGGSYGSFNYPMQVPEGKVFLLGDNRGNSFDSRSTQIGFVDEEQILGKALYRIFPFDKMGSLY